MENNEENDSLNLYRSIDMLLNFTNKQDLTTTVAMLEANLNGANTS